MFTRCNANRIWLRVEHTPFLMAKRKAALSVPRMKSEAHKLPGGRQPR